MKKIIFLLATVLLIAGCKTQQPILKHDPVCPWQIGQMNAQTITDYQLSKERLLDSKVSIGQDLLAELPTEHMVDSAGRHNFWIEGINIPANSVGVVKFFLDHSEMNEVTPPSSIPLTFQQKGSDKEGKEYKPVTFLFDLVGVAGLPKFLKKEDVSSATLKTLLLQGIKVDSKGYLRNGNDFYYLNNGKVIRYTISTSDLGRYKLHLLKISDAEGLVTSIPFANTGGYLRSGDSYLIQNFDDKTLFLISPENSEVYLDQIKFRVCDEIQTIETGGFDEKIK